MSNAIKAGGPAFPITPENEPRMNGTGGRGMTLRDYFAAKAMAALVAADNQTNPDNYIAQRAFEIADAMLREVEA